MTKTLTLAELHALITNVLLASDTSHQNASVTADALVAADADGIASHGVSRVPFYADQALSGKVDGHAIASVQTTARAVIRVDARDGFAYPAIKAGLSAALKCVDDSGIVGVGIANSHHFGAAGYHVESIAEKGYLALGFSNSPAAMAPWGGSRGSYGTNPIAFACPRQNAAPLVIDLSLSQVARGKVMLAQKRGETIPADWALDAQGNPTTDPEAALAGTMLPLGGAKGAALALMVEILTAALTGSNLASEASSFFSAEGAPPRIAQSFIILDPNAFSPKFSERVEALFSDVLSQHGARLPGERRLTQRARAAIGGVTIAETLYQDLLERSRRSPD
jgi:(2R)-3-sulfolactate dehydrogenase (NADP+)